MADEFGGDKEPPQGHGNFTQARTKANMRSGSCWQIQRKRYGWEKTAAFACDAVLRIGHRFWESLWR